MRLPARVAVAGVALLTCLFALGMLKPERRGPEHLQVHAEFAERDDGLLELHLAWQWDEAGRLALLPKREETLAVSFDTRLLLFEAEEASYGVGVSGESLHLLEAISGFNGARRFYVVPEGRNGEARVVLRPTGADEGGDPNIHIHTVVDPERGEAAVREMLVTAPL